MLETQEQVISYLTRKGLVSSAEVYLAVVQLIKPLYCELNLRMALVKATFLGDIGAGATQFTAQFTCCTSFTSTKLQILTERPYWETQEQVRSNLVYCSVYLLYQCKSTKISLLLTLFALLVQKYKLCSLAIPVKKYKVLYQYKSANRGGYLAWKHAKDYSVYYSVSLLSWYKSTTTNMSLGAGYLTCQCFCQYLYFFTNKARKLSSKLSQVILRGNMPRTILRTGVLKLI